jgi:hypothetical protein
VTIIPDIPTHLLHLMRQLESEIEYYPLELAEAEYQNQIAEGMESLARCWAKKKAGV